MVFKVNSISILSLIFKRMKILMNTIIFAFVDEIVDSKFFFIIYLSISRNYPVNLIKYPPPYMQQLLHIFEI